MIQTDAAGGILQRTAENVEKEILDYREKYSDNMVARKILPVRKTGKDVLFDVVRTYERQGKGAVIAAAGVIPSGSKTSVKATNHEIYQILDGFTLTEKDMNIDPQLQKRNIDLCMRNIHRAEDDFVINGDTNTNIDGIADTPTANEITTSTNHGNWDGTESNDIHADIVAAGVLIDTDFDISWIIGHKTDISYLMNLDSERQPYWKSIMDLFDGARKRDDFIFKTNRITAGHVYVGPKDSDAAELVVGENPTVRTLSLQPGGNYPIEIFEWVVPEIHNSDSFAEVATG